VQTVNTHGTGCTLSSAITAYLARGHELIKAVQLAKKYTYRALAEGSDVQIGHGNGPLNHFFAPEKLIKYDK
jgi:hydroxymethylpyrimidine/phosphomethylpyrimidine kinase